jgi:Cobalamin biosynthesis protein CobT (nicotinate-mononucleotide:5, 6-dimethylbenzimidazole phosphoribosyltransferase)
MKKKLLILCSLLAFLACSDDKSGDGSSAGQLFLEALHSDDVEEDSEDSDPEELDEDSDPEELEEDLDSDEDFIDDSDEQDEPSSSSKKKNAVRSSSSVDKSPESSEYSEVNIEPASSSSNLSGNAWSSSSSSNRSARSSSSSYKNCCADVPSISISPTYSDLWYGDLVAVNTDVYAGEKWKNRDAGLWFTTSDSIDGGESRIIWPVLPGTAYDAASLDPVIEYCYGLCGEFQLSGPALPYDPFVAIGFHLVGLDSNGKDIAVDVSNWEGICIQYTADVIPMLLLDLGDSVNKTLNGDLPRVRLPKSISGADRCYLWSDFEQEGWGRGDHITGEQAATQLVKIIFKIQSIDRSKGYFSIISLGTVKGNK